ncbi:MAG: hypothetical protein GWO39_04050 [Gammaproteobacteria bacterium]|nr:hypothetical protein [Gammaproteobacteria bacterium]NIT62984.1 hypothetical protein [Gammaproteobacteria bacterium]NIY31564.1 hypothetical protein [Gammaproteobacteria bacterium]
MNAEGAEALSPQRESICRDKNVAPTAILALASMSQWERLSSRDPALKSRLFLAQPSAPLNFAF